MWVEKWVAESEPPSSSGFDMQATVEEPQIGLVLHNTSRVGLPIFSYLSLGLKGFIRTRLHRVKSIKGGSLLLGKPLSILKPPSLPNHRYKPGFQNLRHHNLRLSSLESRFRRIISYINSQPIFPLPQSWLHIRLNSPSLAYMSSSPVCILVHSLLLIVLIVCIAHLLRPENEYNRHKYQEVCRPDQYLFFYLK